MLSLLLYGFTDAVQTEECHAEGQLEMLAAKTVDCRWMNEGFRSSLRTAFCDSPQRPGSRSLV